MPRFTESLDAWGTEAFAQTLCREIACLGPAGLPLAELSPRGGYADFGAVTATLLGAAEEGDSIRVSVGLFYTETVGNCGCGDEPMVENGYCELRLRIRKATAEAEFEAMP
ncbi:MAG: glucosamine--fructose-6-phosphate aminotransferase [Gammaproteobacteria bacterium]|nr:glucosamine--fructose-6-phosphate aminotransferase [Gammaproteobacteria bacterium]